MYLMMLEKNNAADETKENHINLDLDIKSQKQLTLFENKLKNPATAAQYVSLYSLLLLLYGVPRY